MSAKTTPIRIYLQWNGDAEPEDSEPCLEEVTWSQEQIFKHDIEYIRADRVKALLHAVKGLAQPCTRADYTFAKLDAIVREIAQKAIDDYSDCANTESKVRLVPITSCYQCNLRDSITCICNLTGKQHTPPGSIQKLCPLKRMATVESEVTK